MAEEKTASEKLVNSVALTLVARVAMVVATGLILPLALVLGQRGLSTIDELIENRDNSEATDSPDIMHFSRDGIVLCRPSF